MYKSKVEPGSRSQMLQWINRILNINETKIENLGNGVVYTMLINHFYPNTIHSSKVIANPRSPHDYRHNLRRLQEAIVALDLKGISFDVFKVSEMTYAENWNLTGKLYKHLSSINERQKSSTSEMGRWQSRSIQNKPEMSYSKPTTPMMINNPMLTPMKNKSGDQGGKMRWQTLNLIEEIKKIVSSDAATDRVKVGQLRRLLDLQEEQGNDQSETDLKDLLSDYKKNKEVIQID